MNLIRTVSPPSPPPQDTDLGTVLVRSMVDGATLIVTEVECQALVTNTLLMDTLLVRKVISRASTPQKVMVSCAHVVQDFGQTILHICTLVGIA